MWIILLDHSGSMGDPFTGIVTNTTRRVREVDTDIKLTAAKEVLIEEINELGDDVSVVIFGFTSVAHLVFEGSAGHKAAIRSSLESLSADNGTDIAAALNTAAEYRLSCKSGDMARIVLISDGKSDRLEAKSAARKCLEAAMGIHFILIDPTEEGKVFAREVVGSVGGTSFVVTSHAQLQESAKSVGIKYREDQTRTEAFLKIADEEAAAIKAEVESRERIEFTAAFPSRIQSDYAYTMPVWVHLERMKEEVYRRLKEFGKSLGKIPRISEAESNVLIPIGALLRITPRIKGLIVNPSHQEVAWFGQFEEAIFQIRHVKAEQDPGICAGFIEIAAAGLLIAQIPVSISVQQAKQRVSWESSTAKMISRVFGSYAREDLYIVRSCKTAYKGLGIHLFIDKDEILSGQLWRDVIRRSIGNHDLFQLFWSQAAADSNEVASEWQLALSIAPQRNEAFIRPLYWSEPMVAPPQELAHINFTFMDIKTLNIEPEKTDSIDIIPLRPIEADFPVMNVIGSDRSVVDTLCRNISKIVPFLEHLIQGRYFPPISFLVDAHTVLGTREELCSSSRNDLNMDRDTNKTEHVISILQSLALGFHVGRLVPENIRYSQRESFFNILNERAKIEYSHVVRMAEWVFSGPVREYLGGQDVWGNQIQSMQTIIEAVVKGDDSGYNLKSMIEWLLEIASGDDSEIIRDIVTEDMLKDLSSFSSERYAEVARKLLNTSIQQLADKYKVYIFFHQPDGTELRLCGTFPEYITCLCNRWQSYVDTSLTNQGDVEIDIGYSAPRSSLEWLAHQLPNIRIIYKREEQGFLNKDEPRVQYHLMLSDYKRCVQYLSELLIKLLDQRDSYIGRTILPVASSTYGVFLPAFAISGQNQFALTLQKYGWPQQASLDGQGKVLICHDAIENIKKDLIKLRLDEAKIVDLAARIAISVLIHEHFHAAIATATDRDGRPPLGSRHRDDWQKGLPLNEALAAWAERHFFRSDQEMSAHINEYVLTGEYPAWPYRGADFLEEVYRKGGLPSVRTWIGYLRDDPVNAQKEFDRQIRVAKEN